MLRYGSVDRLLQGIALTRCPSFSYTYSFLERAAMLALQALY